MASDDHLLLEKGGLTDIDFMSKILVSLEENRVKTEKERKEECTFRMELERLGLAYMVLKPGNTQKKEFTMNIDQNRL